MKIEKHDDFKKNNMPEEIKKWNWGAFFLNWIWAIGNNTYKVLWLLIPPLFIIMPFYLGAKGNELAWKNKEWKSIKDFESVQKKWKRAGLIIFSVFILFAILLPFLLFSSFSDLPPFTEAISLVNNNEECIHLLGSPIEKGFLYSGSISITGPSGKMDVAFPVKGDRGKGKLYLKAKKEMGEWKIEKLVLKPEKGGQLIDILK